MRRRSGWVVAVLASWAVLAVAPAAGPRASVFGSRGAAQAPRLAAREGPPRWAGDALELRVLGVVLSREGRLGARRAAARRRALERARVRLHAWLDDRLAAQGASPVVATRVHAVVDEHARVVRARPLVDGSVVVEVAVPRGLLRDAGMEVEAS